MDKQYENELLHEIDDLRQELKRLKDKFSSGDIEDAFSYDELNNLVTRQHAQIREMQVMLNGSEKALELACERIKEDNPVIASFGFNLKKYYLTKAKEEIDKSEWLALRDEEY